MLTLLSFYILPLLGGLISALVYGVPTLFPATTLALLMLFIKFQAHEISVDGLTGLNNRRQFDMNLQTMIADVHRQGHLMLLLTDIDSFKNINDTYGHLEGDHALIETAKTLKRICRGRDVFLCRYGGDEFAIICNFHDASEAYTLKQDIIEAFKERNESNQVPYSIVMSIGIKEFSPDHGDSIKALLSGADKELYKDKALHKNNVNRLF